VNVSTAGVVGVPVSVQKVIRSEVRV